MTMEGVTLKRIEPQLGSLDLTIDSEQQQRARAAARKRRFRHALGSWLTVLLLSAILVGGTVAAAIFGGVLSYPEDFQWTNLPGRLIVVGMALVYLAQILAGILAFRISFVAGGLSLLVPGYLFLCLKRVGRLWPVAGIWLLGAASTAAGAILLS